MRGTITDIDIAFLNEQGMIIETMTMPAGANQLFIARQPFHYALELSGGAIARYKIKVGDVIYVSP